MKIFLTIVMCSSVAQQCLTPHTFDEIYRDSYTCLMDGYKKSYEKLEEIGRQEVNQHGIYLKFDCGEIIIPPKKPGSPT